MIARFTKLTAHFQALFLTVVTQVTVRLEHSSERLNTLETQTNCVVTYPARRSAREGTPGRRRAALEPRAAAKWLPMSCRRKRKSGSGRQC